MRQVMHTYTHTHTHTHSHTLTHTLRFSHPERELMRQVINLNHLSGGGAASVFSGPALRSLAVAASHPDVITGAGSSSGMAGGPGTRDEVRA